jgi:hypothetical protein
MFPRLNTRGILVSLGRTGSPMENRRLRRMQSRLAARACAPRKPAPSVWLVLVAGLLALAIQGFVVQTHIHIAAEVSARASQAQAVAADEAAFPSAAAVQKQLPADRYPVKEDPANCPLCQEFHGHGQFVMPMAALFALPVTENFTPVVSRHAAPAIFTPSHHWRGRAPPSV